MTNRTTELPATELLDRIKQIQENMYVHAPKIVVVEDTTEHAYIVAYAAVKIGIPPENIVILAPEDLGRFSHINIKGEKPTVLYDAVCLIAQEIAGVEWFIDMDFEKSKIGYTTSGEVIISRLRRVKPEASITICSTISKEENPVNNCRFLAKPIDMGELQQLLQSLKIAKEQ